MLNANVSISKIARNFGMSRTTLYKIIEEHELVTKQYRYTITIINISALTECSFVMDLKKFCENCFTVWYLFSYK